VVSVVSYARLVVASTDYKPWSLTCGLERWSRFVSLLVSGGHLVMLERRKFVARAGAQPYLGARTASPATR
jgi:hypothetical protein